MIEGNKVLGRIILGSGRSGTTWVQDCLADANQLRPIFEPLNPEESELGRQYAYRMIAPGTHSTELEKYFVDLSLGRISSLWIDYRGLRSRLFPSPSNLLTVAAIRSLIWHWRRHLRDRKGLRRSQHHQQVLIKCIRANLMAGWISRDLGFRTVLLVRHPCASVESQYRNATAWNPEPVLERYRSDERLHEATQGFYLPLLNSRLSRLEALTLNWVIENQQPVAQGSAHGYTTIYYEQLRSEPSIAWPEMCKALKLTAAPSPDQLRAPSQQTYEVNSKSVRMDKEPRWQQALDPDQLREIQSILDITECDLYNVTTPLPLQLMRR